MLQDFLSEKKASFADGVQTVLRGQENRNRMVTLQAGNLVSNARSESRGINARVCKNGVAGFSSIAEYSDSAADKVLKAATENALFLNNHGASKNIILPSYGVGTVALNKDIVDAKQNRIIDTCKEIDEYIIKHCPNIKSRSVRYTEDSQDKIIVTSDAYSGHVTIPRCYIYVTLNGETPDGKPIERFESIGGYGSFEENFSDLSKVYAITDTLYQELMDKCNGVYADAGLKTVILGGSLPGMIAHEAVGHTVESDLVLGGSVAGPNLNKRVGSDLVNLVDFANTCFGETAPLPVYLDDEGTLAEDAVIIKNGILTGFMHNRESANHFGVKPNGNARGWDFSDEPLVRMRNTCVLPGKDKLEDMIASIEDGYYLTGTNNGQADLTGEFMFGICMGYEIKNGKLGRAILDTTVSGIAFEMLKTVDMVSDKVNWSSAGFCGKKQRMAVSIGGAEIRCQIMMGGR